MSNITVIVKPATKPPLVAFAAPGGLSMLANTPFYLTPTSKDDNSDALTFILKQMDQ